MSLSSAFSLPERRKPVNVPPGFGLALGFSLLYLALIVLIPLSATVLKTFIMTWDVFRTTVIAPYVVVSCKLAFGVSLIAAVINLVLGLIMAWVPACYRFPGKRLIDALVDLPLVLPIAVAGTALTASYAPNGRIGSRLEPLGSKVAFTSLGIVVVLTFIGLPLVVYTVQPVLEDLETELEEAVTSLGATRWQILIRAILPTLLPVLLTGSALAFACAIGEYGSVIFIADNMSMVSEIMPLMVYSKLEQFDYTGATIIAVAMLGIPLALLLVISLLQAWARRRGNRNDTIERAPEPSTAYAVAGV